MRQPNLSGVAEDRGDSWASSPGLGGFPAWEPAGSTPRLLPSPHLGLLFVESRAQEKAGACTGLILI